jgi:hypothetical protein
MNSSALQVLVLWPLAIAITALVSMGIWKTFSWSELILDAIVGMVIGGLTSVAFATGAGHGIRVMLIPSHGLIGILQFTGALHIATLSSFFLTSALCAFGATLLAAALDHAAVKLGPDPSAGSIVLGIIMLPLKLTFAPLTTGVGLVFFLVGAVRSIFPGGRVGLAGGELYVEWDRGGDWSSATTLGGTVQIWKGSFSTLIDHELYHTRQCIYLRDWMIPAWLVGGIWGLISAGIADKDFKAKCFQAARKGQKGIGNPIEAAAYNISGGNNC